MIKIILAQIKICARMDYGQLLVRMLKVVDVSVEEVITAVGYRSCNKND